MLNIPFISFHSLHLGLVFIFTLLIAANSWADEFKQKKFKGVEIDEIPDQTYTADSICPTPDIDVPDSLKPFVKDTDYKVYCYDNVNAGEATLVVEGIGNYADTIKTIFIIKRAPLTVTAKNDTITYGEEPSNAGVEYSGFVGDDDECSLDDSLILSYEYGQYGKPGDYAIIPSGFRSENYEIEFVEGKLTVLPKKLTVTAKNDTITYGDEFSYASVEYSGFVGNDNESSLEDSLILSYEYGQYCKPGDYAIIPSGLRSDKYEIEFVEGKLTVLPKKLTVTAKNDTITYGDEFSYASVEYSGFVGEENESVLNGTLAYECKYNENNAAGEYDITLSGLTSDNYEIKFVAGKLTVYPKTVSITWGEQTVFVYNGSEQVPTATAEGFLEGDDCELTVTGAKKNVGKYTATVAGLSNHNYKLSPASAKREFEIVPKVIHTSGAVKVLEDQDGKRAVIDGEYRGDGSVDIPEGIEGVSIEFNRTFTVGKYSTIVLPFEIAEDKVEGAEFYKIEDIKVKIKDGDTIWGPVQISKVTGKIEANTPYLLEPTATGLVFKGPVTLNTSEKHTYGFTKAGVLWEFRGTYHYFDFGKDSTHLVGKSYGFAAKDQADGLKVGEFRWTSDRSYIPPMRGYLVCKKVDEDNASQKNSQMRYAPRMSTSSIPETIDVEIVDKDGGTTVIGKLDSRTGEIRLNGRTADRWFDLQGRVLKGKPTVKGRYLHNGRVEIVK